MAIVKLNQKLKRVEIGAFEADNAIVFEFFNKLPSEVRDETLLRAIYIGVLALMEDRLSAFLAKTSNELGTELEGLKRIFDMKQEIFYKTTVKGLMAEEDIAEYLNEFFSNQKLKDSADLTGNIAGKISKNKTGDIICRVNGEDDIRIVIECKFDKSIKLGDIASKDVFTRKTDTVWSQLIEAQANRDGKVSIIALDFSLVDGVVLEKIQNVRFIPEVGFVSIVDSQKGDFSNLTIAYMLARDIALQPPKPDADNNLLYLMVNRLLKDITNILSIKSLVINNIENNKKILSQLEKCMLIFEFHEKYFNKFLSDGVLTKEDLLNFYNGDDLASRYRIVEKEILEAY